MQNHTVPISSNKFIVDMSSNIIINLREVLSPKYQQIGTSMIGLGLRGSQHTDTKKLEVPSERPKTPGNSLSHVSSPYIMIFPPRCLICASQLSWLARVEDVSDSAKLRITSKKLGIEPVVRAFTRGIVIVGEVACAVNGIAEPEDMRLHNVIDARVNGVGAYTSG